MAFDYTLTLQDSTSAKKYARSAREVMRLFYELKAVVERIDDSLIDGIGEGKLSWDEVAGHNHDGTNSARPNEAPAGGLGGTAVGGVGFLRYAIINIVCPWDSFVQVDFSATGITRVVGAFLTWINTEPLPSAWTSTAGPDGTPLYANKSLYDWVGLTNRGAYLLLVPGTPDVLHLYQNIELVTGHDFNFRVFILGIA